jgi:rare lipoprotein A
VLLLACTDLASGRPALAGQTAASAGKVLETRVGKATYYGPKRHGRTTASGVKLDKSALVAAHPSWPFGTLVRVTNLRNDRAVKVRVVDRGPSRGPRRRGVIIDVSLQAAQRLGFVETGRTEVRLEVLSWGDG